MYVTVFQVDPFRGMKKVHIKQNSNVSFSFKRDTKETTNVVSKIKSNLILWIFVFYLQAAGFLAFFTNSFSGRAFKKQPDLFMFLIFFDMYPAVNF